MPLISRFFLAPPIFLSTLGLVACGAVDVGSIAQKTDGGGNSGDAAFRDAGPLDPVSGMPCSSLHGTATLRPRQTYGWPACAFSFRFATQDAKLSNNNFDVCYDQGLIGNILISGDPGGFLVDLGDVAFLALPKMVDPALYPKDTRGTHDELAPIEGHTFFQRLERTAGRQVAAFRITQVTSSGAAIEWLRSPDPDSMVVPTACLN